MNKLSGFFNYFLVDRENGENHVKFHKDPDSDESVEIAEIVPSPTDKKPSRPRRTQKASSNERTIGKLIIQINRILVIISLLSFISIIIYPLINSSAQLPDVIPNTFAMTVGYFASAVITYLERGPSK